MPRHREGCNAICNGIFREAVLDIVERYCLAATDAHIYMVKHLGVRGMQIRKCAKCFSSVIKLFSSAAYMQAALVLQSLAVTDMMLVLPLANGLG